MTKAPAVWFLALTLSACGGGAEGQATGGAAGALAVGGSDSGATVGGAGGLAGASSSGGASGGVAGAEDAATGGVAGAIGIAGAAGDTGGSAGAPSGGTGGLDSGTAATGGAGGSTPEPDAGAVCPSACKPSTTFMVTILATASTDGGISRAFAVCPTGAKLDANLSAPWCAGSCQFSKALKTASGVYYCSPSGQVDCSVEFYCHAENWCKELAAPC